MSIQKYNFYKKGFKTLVRSQINSCRKSKEAALLQGLVQMSVVLIEYLHRKNLIITNHNFLNPCKFVFTNIICGSTNSIQYSTTHKFKVKISSESQSCFYDSVMDSILYSINNHRSLISTQNK